MLAVALTVRFILELAMLAGATLVAFYLTPGWLRLPVTIVTPIAIMVVWGLLLSPKATVRIPWAAKLALEALLFLGTSVLLFVMGLGLAAVLLALVWAVDRAAIALLQT